MTLSSLAINKYKRVARIVGLTFLSYGVGLWIVSQIMQDGVQRAPREDGRNRTTSEIGGRGSAAKVPPMAAKKIPESSIVVPKPLPSVVSSPTRRALVSPKPVASFYLVNHQKVGDYLELFVFRMHVFRKDGWYNTGIPLAASAQLEVDASPTDGFCPGPILKLQVAGYVYGSSGTKSEINTVISDSRAEKSIVMPPNTIDDMKIMIDANAPVESCVVTASLSIFPQSGSGYSSTQNKELSVLRSFPIKRKQDQSY
jgi:hypothetical protein